MPLVLCGADPPLPDGTQAATKQIAAFRYPQGLRVELFAAEPMLASPVAFCLDERGRVFVAEEYRFNRGTEENRTRPFLLDDDLQIRTLDDRLAMYRRWAHKFDGGMEWFSRQADQIRLLEDRAGKGRADFSTVFADGFNNPLDGLAAGVLARDGDLYVACIPHLWRLRDTKNTGKADVREPLLRGFGVNCAYLGHDLHGLVWGPDGRLYFSVGDRGFHVQTKEGTTLSAPRRGAVFRCDPDGSNLEVVHVGLRNPQELAFDQFGNLFADDNNCDKGDHARLVYVVEGGDSGWNMAYQTIPEPYLVGPWHAEKMWHLAHSDQPKWIVPPVAKLGAGPSGFCFTSGLSLPERYRNRFFYCNYTGNGGIESFGLTPKGASFDIVDLHDFLKPIQATDVDFGYDGKMYVSDFVGLDWSGKSKGGRIYTVFDPKRVVDPAVQEVAKLFREGFKHRPESDLAKLLRHADYRVRQQAQFALAERDQLAIPIFGQLLPQSGETGSRLVRLHAMWGLGQIARRHPNVLRLFQPLLHDPDPEIRAQAVRIIGDLRFPGLEPALITALTDDQARVQFFAAQALGRLKHRPAIDALYKLARDHADRDPYLRHAVVQAMAAIGDRDAVAARVSDASPAVRLVSLLAMRKWNDPAMVRFLNDPDLDIVTEAARAVHDLHHDDAMPALAATLDRLGQTPAPHREPLLRRALNAHFRLGKPENAKGLTAAIRNPNFSQAIRAEAIAMLADWANPAQRDRVTGFWRPIPKRDAAAAREALEPAFVALLEQTTGTLQADLMRLAVRLNISTDADRLAEWVGDARRSTGTRQACLRWLEVKRHPRLISLIETILKETDPQLRATARDVLTSVAPDRAVAAIREILKANGPAIERQSAIQSLARLTSPEASKLLDNLSARLAAGDVPPELRLDVLETLRSSPTPERTKAIERFEAARAGSSSPLKYSHVLYGGDAARGRELFVGHGIAQCIRCHKVAGQGGDAGPDLSGLAARYPDKMREHFLESLLDPSAKIAPGFGYTVVTLNNGRTIAGTIQAEDSANLTLLTPDGIKLTIALKDTEDRTKPTSAMPPMEGVLNARELRDMIEYLTTLK